MNYKYQGKTFQIARFPKSSNKSLRPWSASDEITLQYLEENNLLKGHVALYNDRFGFFTNLLSNIQPISIIDYKSQERANIQNFNTNKITFNFEDFINPLEELSDMDIAIIKIPKSLELFELHLQNIAFALNSNGMVVCHFMTRNFSKQMVEIAGKYFEGIEQSKAIKKARMMILRLPKKIQKTELINDISFSKDSFKQYFGVFSSNHIDYASQFLLENLKVEKTVTMALDLASGNGVLAHEIRKQNSSTEIHLLDDMYLAVESSKLNIKDENSYFHWNNTLEEFENNFFDLIVCNPPFHFEYETNIEVSLDLFKQAKRCLKPDGSFWIVGNKHLNYKTHLDKLFRTEIINQNDKFIIYRCTENAK